MIDYKEILADSSRMIVDIAAQSIFSDNKLFDSFLNLSLEKSYPYNMRAARVIQVYSEQSPDLLIPYLDNIIPTIIQSKTSGVVRSFLKVFAVSIPLNQLPHQTLLLNACFDWLISNKQDVSIRYYALILLNRFAEKEPDLLNEINLIMSNLDYEHSKSLLKYWGKTNRPFKQNNRF